MYIIAKTNQGTKMNFNSRFSCNDFTSKGSLNCYLKQLPRKRILQTFTYGFANRVCFVSETEKKCSYSYILNKSSFLVNLSLRQKKNAAIHIS